MKPRIIGKANMKRDAVGACRGTVSTRAAAQHWREGRSQQGKSGIPWGDYNHITCLTGVHAMRIFPLAALASSPLNRQSAPLCTPSPTHLLALPLQDGILFAAQLGLRPKVQPIHANPCCVAMPCCNRPSPALTLAWSSSHPGPRAIKR